MQQQDFFICRSGSNGITATTSKQHYIFISKPGHQMCIFFNVSFRAEEKHCQLPSFVLSVSMIQLRVVNSENSYQCVLTDIFSVWFRVLSSHLNISLSLSLFSLVGEALWRIILLQIIPILFESRVKQKTLSQKIQRQRCCEIQERGGRPWFRSSLALLSFFLSSVNNMNLVHITADNAANPQEHEKKSTTVP